MFFTQYNYKLFPLGSISKIITMFFSKMYYPGEPMSVEEIDKRVTSGKMWIKLIYEVLK